MFGSKHMSTVAVGIHGARRRSRSIEDAAIAAAAAAECAELSACFIRDLSRTIDTLAGRGDVTATRSIPRSDRKTRCGACCRRASSDAANRGALDARSFARPPTFSIAGHRAVILVGSDSPTLPQAIIGAAVDAVLRATMWCSARRSTAATHSSDSHGHTRECSRTFLGAPTRCIG